MPIVKSLNRSIVNCFYAGGLCSDWKFRVIKRAPLLKLKYAHAH